MAAVSLLQQQPLLHPLATTITRKNAGGRANACSWRLEARAGMLEDVANTAVPCTSRGRTGESIQAFLAFPSCIKQNEAAHCDLVDGDGSTDSAVAKSNSRLPVVILLHEFWGLAPEICQKAEAIAEELNCIVVAPDTYRGQSTRFIPKAIFLALTTPQERVNEDLDEVLSWVSTLPQADIQNVGIIGFCYGGGKALRFGLHYKKAKAIVVIYGKPVLEVESLKNIRGSVLALYGDRDNQFSLDEVKAFKEALSKAGVSSKICIYEGQGHGFWRNMDQVRRGDEPQTQAWIEVIGFLQSTLCIKAC